MSIEMHLCRHCIKLKVAKLTKHLVIKVATAMLGLVDTKPTVVSPCPDPTGECTFRAIGDTPGDVHRTMTKHISAVHGEQILREVTGDALKSMKAAGEPIPDTDTLNRVLRRFADEQGITFAAPSFAVLQGDLPTNVATLLDNLGDRMEAEKQGGSETGGNITGGDDAA